MGTAFNIKRGDSKPFTINHKVNGSLIDTTGYTYNFTVREVIPPTTEKTDTGAILSKSVIGNSSGIMSIDLSKTDTDIDPKTYLYDIQYEKPDGSIHSSATGKFIVEADITRTGAV